MGGMVCLACICLFQTMAWIAVSVTLDISVFSGTVFF